MLHDCKDCGRSVHVDYTRCGECREERYEYRAYCDICKTGSEWLEGDKAADKWRDTHFENEHPDNPMKKTNCRIQRRTTDETA